jgi:(p)ppGpp synthase/HD superfamily hydrolase
MRAYLPSKGKDMNTEHGIDYPKSQSLIDFAYEFAKEAHGDQKRKYTGEPYITHPVAVAKLVMTAEYYDCEMLAAAILHDVIEDTDATHGDIAATGLKSSIANLVLELTDVSRPEDGNRAKRKAMDRDHLATASFRAKTIKLADLINNSESITEHAPGFAKVYMKEKAALLDVLEGGDVGLMDIARGIVNDYYSVNRH